jgi:hypothetical protein
LLFWPIAQNTIDEITADEIRAHVEYLASDELEGRNAGHPGSELAAAYLIEEFDAYGFLPLLDAWEYPFAMLGAATDGKAKVKLRGEWIEDTSHVQVPTFSAVGSVQGTLSVADAVEVSGNIVAVIAGPNERIQATEFIERGAMAVLLLRDHVPLEPQATGPVIFRPPIDPDHIPDDLPEDFREAALNLKRLAAPVVAVSRKFRDRVLDAAEKGLPISIEVTRRGKDESTNVLAIIEGSDPELSEEYVILGAHYDHIGLDRQGGIYHGADDNASGTAGLLEIAEAFACLEESPRRSIAVIGWGAEERGLVGSTAFCRQPPIDLANIAAYINLDMIGRNDPENLQVLAASDDLYEIAIDAARRHGFPSTDVDDPAHLASTDSHPFVKRQVPTISFTTGLHADYNKVSDTVERLDVEKTARVARTAFEVAFQVANSAGRPTFSAPK